MVGHKIEAKPEKKILYLLSGKKEFEQYYMPKATGISYRTILRTLPKLEKNEAITLIRTEPSKKGGKERKIYTVTPGGVEYVFFSASANKELTPKLLSEMVDTQQDKEWFFKKWPFFEDNGALKFVEALIFSDDFSKYVFPEPTIENIESFGVDRYLSIANTFFDFVLFEYNKFDPKRIIQITSFLRICQKDDQLKDVISEIFDFQNKEFEEFAKIKISWDYLLGKLS